MITSFKTILTSLLFTSLVILDAHTQDCPSDLMLNIISYNCNQSAQTYEVVFTLRSPAPVSDPWMGSTVQTDWGNLTQECQSNATPGNPDCNYMDPPNWTWSCACDGRTYDTAGYPDFTGCTSLTIVSNSPCDGTYPVKYTLTDVPFGVDVTLSVWVTLVLSFPDLFWLPCEYSLGIPAPPAPVQPGMISGAASVCAGQAMMYSISNIPGATGYEWTVPNGASILSGQGTNTVQISWGNTSGDLCVASTSDCNVSTPSCTAIEVAPQITLTNISTNSLTGTFTLNGGLPQINGSNYAAVTMTLQGNPGVSATLTNAPFTHQSVVGFTVPQMGTYQVEVTDGNGCTRSVPVMVSGGGGGMMEDPPCIEWSKCFGGSDFELHEDIKQTADGGFVLIGLTASNDGNVSGNKGATDYWVVKLDMNGNIQWQNNFGGTNDEYPQNIEQTSDGGYILCGSTNSNDFDVSGNHGGYDCWIVKLNATGSIQWQRTFGGGENDFARTIVQMSDGGFVISAETRSNDGDVIGNHGINDFWILKLDSSGNLVWQNTLGGSNDDSPFSLHVTNDGGFIVAGISRSNDGDVSGNHGSSDMWVTKLNATGNIQWQRSLGGSYDETGWSIQQTIDGGFIVAGGTASSDGDVTTNQGNNDVWVIKLSITGNIEWQKTFGGNDNDYANSIQQINDGGFVIGATSRSNNGDVSGNQGDFDFWVFKLNVTGDLLWQKNLGGSAADEAISVSKIANGSYAVSGRTSSNNGDVSGNHGDIDFWVVKLSPPAIPATCPSLITPAPNSANVPTTTSLHWNNLHGCLDGYHLSLGTTPGGTDLLNNQTVSDSFYQPGQALPAGATIYVRIVPFNSLGEASGCQEFSFMTAAVAVCDVVRDSMALVALFDATGGLNWTHQDNWKKQGQPLNTWYGVRTSPEGCVACLDLDGQVDCYYPNGGDYGGNNLSGNLPAEIGDLKNIDGLYLSNNKLVGAIPVSIGGLTLLRDLFMYNNQFTGTIPTEFNALSNLIYLDVYKNQLSGPVPKSLGLGHLNNLRGLYLSRNQFSGPIPTELNNLKELRHYYISDNQLSGQIPDFNMPFLEHILLYNNQLSGKLPKLQTPNLELLWLANNQLDDTIPDFNLPNLKSIGLDQNRMHGAIPKLLNTPLRGMGLWSNRFTFDGMPFHIAQSYIDGFSYVPQDSIFFDTLIIRAPGQTLTVDLGIDANVVGNQYQWFHDGNLDGTPLSNNQRTFTNLSANDAGTYHVQVTNQAVPGLILYSRAIRIQVGCSGVPAPIITGPSSLCSGTALLSVVGNYSSPPQWSTGQSGNTISISTPGTYSVTITDANGCTNSNAKMVGTTSVAAPVITGPTALCSGTATLLVSGNYALSPQWSTGQLGNAININSAGTYTVTVTESGNCTNTNSISVSPTGALNPPAITGALALCNSALTTLVAGGNYPVFPKWSNGQIGYAIIVGPGLYTVTVTDVYGCTGTNTHQISLIPEIHIHKDTIVCPGESVVFCGSTLSLSDSLSCHYTTAGGCDSTLTMHVVGFNPAQFEAETDNITLSAASNTNDFDVTSNDTHPGPFVLKILQGPAHGTATVLNNNQLRYVRDTFAVLDSLQYGLCAPGNCPNICVSAWVLLQAQSGSVDQIKHLIPNLITPNNDGFNDTFDPAQIMADNGIVADDLDLFIINRWGEVIYHDKKGRWEGNAPQATYYYRLKVIVAGKESNLQGSVNLLR